MREEQRQMQQIAVPLSEVYYNSAVPLAILKPHSGVRSETRNQGHPLIFFLSLVPTGLRRVTGIEEG